MSIDAPINAIGTSGIKIWSVIWLERDGYMCVKAEHIHARITHNGQKAAGLVMYVSVILTGHPAYRQAKRARLSLKIAFRTMK